MKVGGAPFRTIWLADDGETVEIIDQTRLPHAFTTLRLESVDHAARAIRDMEVRGAPLIGAAAAYGVALAMRLRGEARAAVCVMGDGATSKGDVYEAMNAAGVWALPVLFVVNNNQWAISVSRAQQTASKTLAQKAIACGFNGEQVDGNDVIAVRQVVDEALARMRNGDGPHLIEAITYRMTDHTTADDAGRYRDEHEVSEHWKEDPIKRLRIFLTENHGWSRNEEEDLISGCQDAVDVGVAAYLETAAQDPESMFDYLYETLPEALASQRSALSVRRNSDG